MLLRMIINISFKSDDPCDHIPRSLDFIRRMGFALHSLRVDNENTEPASVEIALSTAGDMSARTYFERIRQMPGVSDASACDSLGSVKWSEYLAENVISENAYSRLESLSH